MYRTCYVALRRVTYAVTDIPWCNSVLHALGCCFVVGHGSVYAGGRSWKFLCGRAEELIMHTNVVTSVITAERYGEQLNGSQFPGF